MKKNNIVIFTLLVICLMSASTANATNYNMTGGNNYEINYEFDLADTDAIFVFTFISPYPLLNGTPVFDTLYIESNNKTITNCHNETSSNTFTLFCDHKFNESHYDVNVHIRLNLAIMPGLYNFNFNVISYIDDKPIYTSGSSSSRSRPYINTATIYVEYVQAKEDPIILDNQTTNETLDIPFEGDINTTKDTNKTVDDIVPADEPPAQKYWPLSILIIILIIIIFMKLYIDRKKKLKDMPEETDGDKS